jgi:hypothetical protein
MNIVYLANVDLERAERVQRLMKEGYGVTCTDSVKEAEHLMEQGSCHVVLYEWPFADQLRWIKKRFRTIERNPDVTFEKFLTELKQAFPADAL